MGEPRRIEVMSNVGVNLEKNKNKTPPTARFVVPLTQSTDDTYPEFSYAELCKNLEEKQVIQLDPDDPFAAKDHAEHEKMLAVARGFESKYGPPPGKRKHVSIVEDFVDLGEGYEEDSFVDNSEAYDELVPSTMRTKYGGFYINTGELDFVSVDDASQDGQPFKKKMKKRKVIQSDDEDDRSGERKKKVQKMKENGTEEPVKKKRKRLIIDDGKRRKGPPGRVLKSDKSRTVAEILSEVNQTSTPTAIKPPPEPSQNLAISPIRKTVNPSVDKSVVSSPTLILNRSISVTAEPAIEKDATDEPSVECLAPKNELAVSKIESSIDAVILQAREGASSDDGKEGASEAPQGLPDSLPAEVLRAVERIVELASSGKLSSDESASGLRFTPEVQQLLLEIHELTQKMSSAVRSAVYGHLGNYFPCGKEALIKRIKKLDLTQHGDRLKQPIAKLKDAIDVVMPSLIEKHRVEVSAKEKLRLDQLQEQKEKKEPKDGTTQSDSDEEDDNRDTAEKQRRIVAPRKKFEWNEEIRKHLCKVVDIKMEHFAMAKIRSQTPEEYLKSFLEAEIKSLWPPGWIQTRMLFKESRSSHNRWTSNVQKMKKSGLVTPKTSTAIVGTPADINPDAGMGLQAGNFPPLSIPVSIPSMKASIWPSLDEVASTNFNKTLEPHPAPDTPGAGTTNGTVRPDSSADVLFTSISTRPGNVSDKEIARSDRRDSSLENDLSNQKLRKMLGTPVFVQELDLSMSHSVMSKSSRIDRSAIMSDADMSDVKVVSISSSTGSDTSTTKAENLLGTSSVIDRMATERPTSSCPPKGLQSAAVVPQGYLNEFIHFSSKKVNPGKQSSPGQSNEDHLVDATGAVDLAEQSLGVADDLASTPIRSSGASFAHSSESEVQSASGRPCEPSSMPVTGPGRDPEVDFTEVRPLQRQSSHDVTVQTVADSTVRKVTPITLDTFTVKAPLNSHKAQELMTLKNDTNFSSSHRDQLASSRTMPKARNLNQPQMLTLSSQQKLTGSPTSSAAQRWSSKTPLAQAWMSPGSYDARLKSVMDLGTSVSSGGRSSVVNLVPAHSSGMPDMQHISKDSSSRTSTAKTVSMADDRNLGRQAGGRTGVQAEDAMKCPPRLASARQPNTDEAILAAIRSEGSDVLLNQVLRALFNQEQMSLMMSQGSLTSTQGSKKTPTADAQPFPSTTSASDLTKHGPDAARMFQGKSLVSSATAQSLWRPTDQARNSSASLGLSTYSGSGYRGGQQQSPGFSGDGSVDYSQHQSSKMSASSSSHDQLQNLEVLKHPVSQSSNSGAPAAGHSQQLKVFYGSSAVQHNTSASQGQKTSTNNMSFKTDSQSSQHHHQ